MSAPSIQFLTWSGCPSHDDAIARLNDVLAEIGRPDHAVEVVWVETDEAAQTHGFVGSPTFRVRGEDVVPVGDDALFGLTCRVYRTPAGRFSPLPDRGELVSRLEQLLKGAA